MSKQRVADANSGAPVVRSITVAASASVSKVPDVASVSARIISDAQTAADALSENNRAMLVVVEGLSKLGISGGDVQTASFQVEPRYASKSPPGASPQITGYRVVNQLDILVRSVDRLGLVLDQLVRLGVNQMDSLSFDVSDAAKLRDEARAKAMAVAFSRAKMLAAAAGAEVGPVLTIIEGGTASHGVPAMRAMMEAVPVARGTAEIGAEVCVTWALQ